jgi:hypothetical protein
MADVEYQRVYWVWAAMVARCHNPKTPQYKNYGARGIAVCDRWRLSANFISDMGPRPTPKHTLERDDNDLGYGPSNCRWATRKDQVRNKGRYRKTTALPCGITQVRELFRARIRVDKKGIHLGYFGTVESAIAARAEALKAYGFNPNHGTSR